MDYDDKTKKLCSKETNFFFKLKKIILYEILCIMHKNTKNVKKLFFFFIK